MTNDYSATITLDSLSETREIPGVKIKTGNLYLVAGLAAIGYAIGVALSVGIVGMVVIVGTSTLIGLDLVRSAPPYCTALQWVRAVITYYRSPSKFTNAAHAHLETDNKLRAAIEAPASTREQTRIARFYPPYGVYERDNGTFEAMMEYTPPNMDFATDEGYRDLMNMIAGWYNNNEIDFDITVHATTQPADVDEYFQQLHQRIESTDSEYNETFRMLLEEMRAGRKRQLAVSDTEVLRVFFIVSVEPGDVADVVGGDDSATDRSRLFRLVSRVLPGQNEDEEDLPDDVSSREVTRRRMEKKLNKRISRMHELTIGHSVATDADIRQLSAPEAAAVQESFWTGRDLTDLSEPGTDGIAPTGPLSPGVDTQFNPDSEQL